MTRARDILQFAKEAANATSSYWEGKRVGEKDYSSYENAYGAVTGGVSSAAGVVMLAAQEAAKRVKKYKIPGTRIGTWDMLVPEPLKASLDWGIFGDKIDFNRRTFKMLGHGIGAAIGAPFGPYSMFFGSQLVGNFFAFVFDNPELFEPPSEAAFTSFITDEAFHGDQSYRNWNMGIGEGKTQLYKVYEDVFQAPYRQFTRRGERKDWKDDPRNPDYEEDPGELRQGGKFYDEATGKCYTYRDGERVTVRC